MTSGYLLDTSVLSLLAPGRMPTDAPVVAWLKTWRHACFISAVTVMEIEQGVRKLRRTGAVQKAEVLNAWLDRLVAATDARVLDFDARVARAAGEISERAMAIGRHPGFADVAIAATAFTHGLVLLTCNDRHFEPLGVPFRNPTKPDFSSAAP